MLNATTRRMRNRAFVSAVQTLEPRRLLAAVSWDGGAGTLAWTDPANWSGDALPTAADDVTINIPAAITVTISSGAQSVNSLSSAEGIALSGGTLAVATPSSIDGPFSLSGTGQVAGAGNLTLNGASTWAAGTMIGAGTTIIGAAGTLAIAGSANLSLQRNLTNNGTVNWTGAADLLMTNSTITNTGTINHGNTGTAIYANTAGINQVINNGTINKSNTGTIQSAAAMTNNGTIAVTAGTFTSTGGLTNNAAMSANGGTINFNSTATHSAASTVTGTGTFLFSAGTHTLEPVRYAPTGITSLQGNAAVTVNATLAQLGGAITGNAVINSPVTINNANVNATLTFNQPVTFTGTTILGGTVSANSTTSTAFTSLQINGGTTTFFSAAALSVDTFTIGGTFSTPANMTINTTGTIGGGGLLGGGTVTVAPFATLNVTGGDTTLSKDLDNDGTFNMSSGGDLNFVGATFTNDGSISFTGSGADFDSLSGTNAFINNATLAKGGANTAAIGVPTTNNGTMTIGTGTLAFDSAGTALTNNATINIASGAELQILSTVFNAGSNVTGAGNVEFATGGTSTIDSATFNTTGDLLFTGGTVIVNLTRTLAGNRAMAGNVTFNQPVTFGGTLTVNSGATTTFASSASIAGNVTVNGRLNVDMPSPGVSIANVAVNSGVLGGTGLLVITGTLTSNGNLGMDGTGTTRLAVGATLPSVGNAMGISGGHTFHNQGTVTMGSNNPDIYLDSATFLNDGVLESVNGTGLDTITNNPGTNLFINNGTILKTVGAASSVFSIEVPMQHNGLINVGPGSVHLSGTGSTYSASSSTSGTGNINFNGGSHTFLGTTTLNGIGTAGIAYFTGGTVTFNVDTTVRNGAFGGSTIEGAGTLSLGNGTTVYGGFFSPAGNGRLRVPTGESAAFNGNNPIVARPLDIFGTLQMPTGGDMNVLNTVVTIETGGTLHFNTSAGGSDVEYASGATSGMVVNKGTVLRDIGGSATIGVRFDNQGLVDCNGGLLAIGGGFADGTFTRTTGVYDVTTSTLNFGTVNTNGAEMIARAGAVINGMSNLQYNDGKLDLRDGIDWSFDPFAAQGNTMYNRGQIELSPGSVFTIVPGNNLYFAGTGNATIRSEIAGPTNAEYGRLVVGGQLRLASPDGGDSQFDPDLVGGYDPATGTRFNIVTAGSIVESFDDYFGATTPSGLNLLAGKTATQFYAEVGTAALPAAPLILSSNYEYQTRQAIVLGFNVDVSAFVSRKDLSLVNLTTNTPVNGDIGQLTYDAGAMTATLTLTNLLANGNYRLTIAADDIANAAGQILTSPLTLDFYVLAGDINRDRIVNFDDLLILAQNYGQIGRTFSQGNIDYSAGGSVTFDDLLILAQRYGTSLAAPALLAPSRQAKKTVGRTLPLDL